MGHARHRACRVRPHGAIHATMSDPDDREADAQSRILTDANAAFRVSARRNRLLAHWAADQMELTPEETAAYAKAVIQSDFEGAGDEDVLRKVLGDLVAAGCDVDQATVRAALEDLAVEARRQLMSES
jgi:hypothetical protein